MESDRDIIDMLARQLEGRERMIETLLERIDSLEKSVRKLTGELATLRRMHYGTSSERKTGGGRAEGEGSEGAEDGPSEEASDGTRASGSRDVSRGTEGHVLPPAGTGTPESGACDTPEAGGRTRKAYRRPERRDYGTVEAEHVIELRPDAAELEGARLLKVDSTFRFYYRPAHVYKVRIDRYIYHRDGHLVTPPLPYAPETFERRRLTPSLAAGILTDKYFYHIPLERQLRMLAAGGIRLAKTTLCDYARAGIEALDGLYEAIRERVLSDERLNIDETVQHLVDTGLHRCRNVYDWGFVSPTHRLVYFATMDGSRGTAALDAQLRDFRGSAIQTDGYGAYTNAAERLGRQIDHIPCMAHVRRKFFDCLAYSRKAALEALGIIEEMFRREARYRKEGLTAAQTEKRRRKELRPLLDRFRLWLRRTMDADSFFPDDNLGKAVRYAWRQIDGFYLLLRNGALTLTNNLAERTMRGHAVGRKNYLFCQNQKSVERTCRIYSIVESCRLSGIDPYAYLNEVLSRRPRFGETWADLLPGVIKL